MKRGKGILLSFIVAGLSYAMSFISPVFDPLVLGIILGIIISNLLEDMESVEEGAEFTIRIFLPLGISLYGFQLKFQNQTPTIELFGLFYTFFGLYIMTFLLSRLLKINLTTSILLSTGMAVCGASAIAVTSPAIDAKRQETSISILSVMTAGLIYTIFYPAITSLISFKPFQFGFLSGATLPMLGLVKVTATQLGEESLNIALRLKYLRISSLVFMVALAMTIAGMKKKKLTIPWFMFFFVIFVIFTNTVKIPQNLMNILSNLSRFFLTITLSAIGLNTTLDAVSEAGLKPFLSTIISITLVASVIVLVFI
jgi:uncharacterized integral membrane protein (TIGR00698 family)